MNRNEYRRAFIMLRAAAQGYGGHVRLERRTLTGSMYFIVNAPEGGGPLRAALAGQRDGQYYATPLGTLSRDRRGQLTLAWQFDPRSIEGRPLEAYAWVAVVEAGDACRVVLTGNVEGARDLDPVQLERAVCALFAGERPPAADLPEPRAEAPATAQEAAEPPEAAQSDVKIYTGSRTRVYTRLPAPAQAPDGSEPADTAPTPVPDPDPGPANEPMPDANGAPCEAMPAADSASCPVATPCAPGAAVVEMTPAASPEAEAPRVPVSRTAARALGLDITRPWPTSAEPLRRLFATQSPAAAAPDAEYVYVSAPMPRGSGFGNSLAGLKAEGGQITGLRYALPARYAPLPPAGLEGYRWLGGGGDGWWVLDIKAE